MCSRAHAMSSSGSTVAPGRGTTNAMPDLTHALVGHTDHRDLRRASSLPMQQVLDLGRVRVEAADDEHVLLAVGDPDVAALVHHADVAGVQPPVGVDRRRRLLGLLEVAAHHVVAARRRPRRARRAAARCPSSSTIRSSVSGIARPDQLAIVSGSSSWRHIAVVPVVSVSPYPVMIVSNVISSRSRSMSRTGTAAAPVTVSRSDDRSYGVAVGEVEDALEQRRRAREHRDALLGHHLEHLRHVEHLERHDRRAAQDARHPAGLVAERVEERVDDEVAVALAQADHVGPRLVDAQRLAVRDHHALRVAPSCPT